MKNPKEKTKPMEKDLYLNIIVEANLKAEEDELNSKWTELSNTPPKVLKVTTKDLYTKEIVDELTEHWNDELEEVYQDLFGED